jgi:hypothetical protein
MISEAEQVRMNRFHGVTSAEWTHSTLSELSYIHIYDQDGHIITAPSGLVGQGGGSLLLIEYPLGSKLLGESKIL